jgi:hypothetical protein
VTLHLTIGNANTGDTTAFACGSFTWYGTEYTESAEPTYTFTNASGCDSVVTLHLTINPLPTLSDIQGQSFVYVDSTITLTNAQADGVWSIEDNSIASINSNGDVTGISAGVTNAVYTYTNNNSCSSSKQFEITVQIDPLPLALLQLNAKAIDNKHINVQWETNNELNVNRYEIERSIDSKNFFYRGVQSAKGNSLYNFLDNLDIASSTIYYRLKMMNNDGSFTYSNIVSVKVASNNNNYTIYPNPFSNIINIDYTSLTNETAILKLISDDGKLINSQKVSLRIGENHLKIINNDKLTKGIYIVELTTNSKRLLKRVLKN